MTRSPRVAGFGLRKPEQRSYTIGDPALAMMLGWTDGVMPTVSETTAMNLSAVYRATSLVAGSVAGLPLRSLQEDPATKMPMRVPTWMDLPTGPDGMTPFEWKEQMMVYLLLHGAAPIQHLYNGAGALVGAAPVHPGLITPEVDETRPGNRRYDARLPDGTKRSFDPRTMTYITGLSLDGLHGISLLTAARLSLGTGISGDKAASKMFRNGAMISGLVTPEDEINEDDAKAIKASLDGKLAGADNAGSIAVINRKLKFTPWTLSAQDAQFLESRTFSVEEIGRWFGVPPHLLGQSEKSTSWGTGISEQNRGLARYNLNAWTSRIEQRLSRIQSGKKWAEFDYSAFVKPSPEIEIKLIIDQVNAGLLTPNEARALRNMPPLPGGDVPRSAPLTAPTLEVPE